MPSFTNYWPTVWEDLRLAITTQWPEVANNFRAIQMEKLNWVNLLEEGTLVVPYVVIHIVARDSQEWGIQNQVWELDVTFYYINADNSGYAPSLEERCKTMQNYVLSEPSPFSSIQVINMLTVDATEANEVNVINLEQNMKYTAGAVGFTCIVGETLV